MKTAAIILLGGWILLSSTSASILLPHWEAALDRLLFSLSVLWDPTDASLKLRTILNLVACYGVLLPLSAYLWAIDEIFYSSYKTTKVERPVFMFSVTRAGTTSFQRTLALDERFVTPLMIDFVLPFLCVQRVVFAIRDRYPEVVRKTENFLKWINGVTPEVDLRHPVGLFEGESDDILFGVWHWVSGDAVRAFPVKKFFWKYYEMSTFRKEDRQRTLRLHQTICQKVLYRANVMQGSGTEPTRLLLRSHFTQCIEDVQVQYPDATLVGIFRNPPDVVRSFAGLLVELGVAGMDKVSLKNQQMEGGKENKTWAQLYSDLLADLMTLESQLHDTSLEKQRKQIWKNTNYVAFPKFKSDPVKTLTELYKATGIGMTEQFKAAIETSLASHQGYKGRHEYKNPTFEDLGLDEGAFKKRQGVQRYSKLMEAKC